MAMATAPARARRRTTTDGAGAMRALRILRHAAWALVALLGLAALAATLGWFGADGPASRRPALVAAPSIGGPFAMRDAAGVAFGERDLVGRPSLIFFGFTHCPDICPTAMSDIAGWMKELGAKADELQVLFVTVDPERDTPLALKEYVSNFHPSFLGLYTTPAATPELALQFRIYYRKVPGSTPGYYNIDHAVFSYAYDPEGRLRLRLSDGLSAADIAADLRRLLPKN